MAKVWNYVFISIGLMLVLHFAGFNTGATGTVFNTIGLTVNTTGVNPTIGTVAASDSTIYNKLFRTTGGDLGILILVGAGAIIVGLFTRAKPENLILVPIILVLVAFLTSYVSIITWALSQGQAWFSFAVSAIFLPISIGFLIALAEFFRGTD